MSENFLQIQKEYLQKVWERESKGLEEFLLLISRKVVFILRPLESLVNSIPKKLY